ncbi:MAG: PA14 domain-containing protein, partial [Ginsengibacter sp.]
MHYFRIFLRLIITVIFFSLLAGCSQKTNLNYKKTDNSVVFDIGNAKLSINIFDKAIMQVRYTLADSFSTKKSLIIQDKKWPQIPFEVKGADNDSDVIISTSKLKAWVNRFTGAIAFYNDKDSLLIKEKAAGIITPSSFEGYQTNTIQQQFESLPGEALYGLGQHQDRLLDIKGYDLDFYQHNMEVYIPFLVSTKGYGLLWNNYSYTKFGHPDSIHAIPAENMFDKNGAQGGLSVNLFKDSSFSKTTNNSKSITDSIAVTITDTSINAARFTGSLLADKTGEYCFYSHSDGTFKCWVNDSLIINNWAPYANARDMGRINLEKGKKYKILVEWSRYSHQNSFNLQWREPQDDKG